MPKVQKGKLLALAKSFKKDCIETDGSVLRCSVCNVTISITKKHQKDVIAQHIKGGKHIKQINLSTSRQPSIFNALQNSEDKANSLNEFNHDLAYAFLKAGVPLNKVEHPAIIDFMEKWTKKSVPCESTLRKKYVKPIYDLTVNKIREVIGQHPVTFILDEVTDDCQRYVLSILVQPLTGEPSKAMLFKMYELEKTNSTTIMQSFMDACGKLWPEEIDYEKVYEVVTDQASYMVSAISKLKVMFPNLNHVTCLAHALHRVCEAIRAEYAVANKFISELKKVLTKAPSRIVMYREITGLCLPKFPILTRWGTWIECCTFLSENFTKVKEFILTLDSSEAEAIKKLQEIINDSILENELFLVHSYKHIPVHIKQLEKSNISKEDQWNVIKTVEASLSGFAKVKLEASLSKNPDVVKFATCPNVDFRIKTKYAPLTSTEVERSFSIYKTILTPNRQNLLFQNIEMLNVIKFNSFL